MTKPRMSIGLFLSLIVVAAAAIWLTMPASHAAPTGADLAAGVDCGKHHCNASQICCPSCTGGEPRCSTGPRCPECAPR